MARTCLGLLAGMYAAQLSSFTVISDALNAVFVATAILLYLRQWILSFCFVAGVFLFNSVAQQLIESRIAPEIEGDSIVVQLQVLDFPTRRNNSITFVANPLDDKRLPRQIRLSWFEPDQLPQLGEIWKLEVRLRRPRGNRNPGGFDFENWLFREHIAATGYVVDSRRNEYLELGSLNLTQRIRQGFVRRVVTQLGDTEKASVVVAIVVGARHLIGAEQWDRYAVTGSSHLMAISGLHIGLAAIGAYYIARVICGLLCWRGDCCNLHRLAVVVALLVALAYVQVSGFALPARRAGLMLGLASLCVLCWRRPDPKAVVSAACILIVVADPLATMSPGFTLSFAAVVTLVWIAQRRKTGLAALQLSLLLALLPLTALLFDQISFAALPVNLIAVPLFSLLTVPLALLGMVLDGPFRAFGNILLIVAAGSVELLESLLRGAAAVPLASVPIALISGVAWLYLSLPILWAALPPRWPGRSVAWAGVVALSFYTPKPPPPDCAWITVLDVGQGLAAAIQTHGHTVLYDTGPSYRGGGSAAQNIVLPFLRSRGVRRIQRMIVSHADLDHAGGVERIVTAMPVDQVVAGELLPNTRSAACQRGMKWAYDGVRFSVLHPPAASELDGNDRSCVLLLEVGAYRMLFTGDIERAGEQALLRSGLLPKVHVVTVPHHGSKTSSTLGLTRALGASFAIVSAGFGNHWGFPKDEVVARWHGAGAKLVNTATAGAVDIRVCAESGFSSITGYRAVKRRIWHE
ncbi:MAG: DNA internalization-related competence protein ComEC/Rec2 [Woeseiaceae bacterium]